jgi:hypothetical protein
MSDDWQASRRGRVAIGGRSLAADTVRSCVAGFFSDEVLLVWGKRMVVVAGPMAIIWLEDDGRTR